MKLRRIAQNLVLNALKYTQEGGVTVKWALGDGEDQRRWMLSIGDTGPGMEPAAPWLPPSSTPRTWTLRAI